MSISSHYYNKSIALYKFWNTKWVPMFGGSNYGSRNENILKSESLINGFYNLDKLSSKDIFEGVCYL